MMKSALFIFITALLWSCKEGRVDDVVRDGDIIFQVSQSAQSKAIQLATKSKYSHCGIIFRNGDQIFVVEAIQPVQSTPLKDWIKRGKDGHYVVKRLKGSDKMLKRADIARMKSSAKKMAGRDYDLYFEWSNKKIYCSELVWKLYKTGCGIEVGEVQSLKDFDLSNPIVKKKIAERYGNDIPYNEKVISPRAIFDSELLETVAAN